MEHGCTDNDVKSSYGNSNRDRVPKMYVTYKTINEFCTILRRNKPFSCIRTKFSRYYGVINFDRDKNEEILQGIPIYFDYEGKYTVDMIITDSSLYRFAVSDIKNFTLALPYIGTSGYQANNKSSMYYIIDSEWNELNENEEFQAPTTPGCTY